MPRQVERAQAVPDAMLPGQEVAAHRVGEAAAGGLAAPAAQPWPMNHEPSSDVEREMWVAYAELAGVPGGSLSLSLVARRSGHSRTMISHEGGEFKLLRRAILDEIARRRPGVAAKPSAAEAKALRASRREEGVKHWMARTREADSRNAAYAAASAKAEAKAANCASALGRILADLRAGRLVRADPSSVLLAEIESMLREPSKSVEQVPDLPVE